ncbi:DUF4381 domain-containing protein [Colwellia echini]|uniref:DUF4381 domain-containing protein n=2 Tax=Colwellia echini TaxID=1982103 RepID=A0ABY3MSZ4_9GAMM|nr:DUF4381 domain-containing protein [Colwellia echini]
MSPGQMQGQPSGQSIQLHDIHLPEQVSDLPIAPGWWILLTLIVIALFSLIKKYKQRKVLLAHQKQALAVLTNNPALSAKQSICLVKWAAMQYFSRQQLAKLYGDSLQQFLAQQLPEKHQAKFIELSNAGFQGQYQAETNVLSVDDSTNESTKQSTTQTVTEAATETVNSVDSDCHQAATLWLNYALPVKKTKHTATREVNKVTMKKIEQEHNA